MFYNDNKSSGTELYLRLLMYSSKQQHLLNHLGMRLSSTTAVSNLGGTLARGWTALLYQTFECDSANVHLYNVLCTIHIVHSTESSPFAKYTITMLYSSDFLDCCWSYHICVHTAMTQMIPIRLMIWWTDDDIFWHPFVSIERYAQMHTYIYALDYCYPLTCKLSVN